MVAILSRPQWVNMLRPDKKGLLAGSIYGIDFLAIRYLQLTEAEWRIYASVKLPSLVQIMACRLVADKPLSETMLGYCYFDS